MRLSLLSLLLLTAAQPALAQAEPEERGEQSDARESAPRVERVERIERAPREFGNDGEGPRARPERMEPIGRTERMERFESPVAAAPEPLRDVARAAVADRSEPPVASGPEPVRGVARAAVAEQWGRPRDADASERAQPNGERVAPRGWGWRGGGGGERRGRARDIPPTAGSPVFGSAVPTPDSVTRPSGDISANSVVSRNLRDRIAAEGLRRDRIEREQWRRDWRQDRRYDWRRHRDRDRSRFHLGLYIDPFGWRYRDYDIGWRLPARFYSSRYWIHDPWHYRLPPVGGPYRWVRYYDDVLLVDLRSGRVLDRIRGFFWSSRSRW